MKSKDYSWDVGAAIRWLVTVGLVLLIAALLFILLNALANA
jgi:hypothetical protein